VNLRTAKILYWETRKSLGFLASLYGEHLGLDFLTYNPVIMEHFAGQAAGAAPVLAKTIVELWPKMKSIVDLGCGTGHYVKAFQDLGKQAIGYEQSRYGRVYGAKHLGVKIRPFDLSKPCVIPPSDVAMSLEVIEHLPPALGERLIDLITQSPHVVFSAAQPGQIGHGHINEQPPDYWRERFAMRGFTESVWSAAVRDHLRAATTAPWLARNVMAFQKG